MVASRAVNQGNAGIRLTITPCSCGVKLVAPSARDTKMGLSRSAGVDFGHEDPIS